MVMRGLPVPRAKQIYIMRDTKREAERLGMPFGRVVDPVGRGVERGLAVLHHAIAEARGPEFVELFLRGAFAEGVDATTDAGLLKITARAGLSAAQVNMALADLSWRSVAETNRVELFDLGLWGVPSFRVHGCEAHWGQDRLWAVERDLAGHRPFGGLAGGMMADIQGRNAQMADELKQGGKKLDRRSLLIGAAAGVAGTAAVAIGANELHKLQRTMATPKALPDGATPQIELSFADFRIPPTARTSRRRPARPTSSPSFSTMSAFPTSVAMAARFQRRISTRSPPTVCVTPTSGPPRCAPRPARCSTPG